MDSKIIIFIVFATVVQSSLGLFSENDGGLREGILVDKSAINNFHGAALDGWHRTVLSFYAQIRIYVDTMFAGANCSDNTLVRALNENKTFSGATAGFDATLSAGAVVHPTVASKLQNIRTTMYTQVTGFVNIFYTGADIARSKNTTAALQTLNTMEANGIAALPNVTSNLFQGIRGGNRTFSTIVEVAYQTTEKNTISIFVEAVRNFFNIIKVLLALNSIGTNADKKATYTLLATYANEAYSDLKYSVDGLFLFMKSIYAGSALLQAGNSAGASLQNPDLQVATLSAYSKTVNDVWKQIENDLKDRDIAKRNQVSTNTCGKKTQGLTFAEMQNAIQTADTSDTSETCYEENSDTEFNVIT